MSIVNNKVVDFAVKKNDEGHMLFHIKIDYDDGLSKDYPFRQYGIKLHQDHQSVGYVIAAMRAMIRKLERVNNGPIVDIIEEEKIEEVKNETK